MIKFVLSTESIPQATPACHQESINNKHFMQHVYMTEKLLKGLNLTVLSLILHTAVRCFFSLGCGRMSLKFIAIIKIS